MATAIPRIIHQTWKSTDIPAHLEGFRASWIDLNPGYDYRFWSDADLEEFVSQTSPDFLSLFRFYPRGISRADLGRYLLLRHYGGIYADLDCQCLRPLAEWIGQTNLIVGTEPQPHNEAAAVRQRGLPHILCPSFVASIPGHPFWEDVLNAVRTHRHEPDVMDSTGPFLLTRVHADYQGDPITLLPSHQIYPFSKEECWSGRIFDLDFWQQRTREAYVAHYWDSSWFLPSRGLQAGVPSAAPVHVSTPTRQLPAGGGGGAVTSPTPPVSRDELPLISCLMVTRGRSSQALRSVHCFLAQSYPNTELVIIDDDPDDSLHHLVRDLHSNRIRHVRLNDEGLSLGSLRNLALAHAEGSHVCQWDDDDLYDPLRLEAQFRVLRASGSQACLLMRWLIWWPQQQRLAVSSRRDWEGSLLCERSVMPPYQDVRRGEDTAVVETLLRNVRVARLDLPRLYVYTVHGGNTFDSSHFESHWQLASSRWEGQEAGSVLRELGRRLPRGVREHLAETIGPARGSKASVSSDA